MKYKNTASNLDLNISGPNDWFQTLPWDIETILDLGLSKDDVHTLELGVVLQIGEMQLSLSEER